MLPDGGGARWAGEGEGGRERDGGKRVSKEQGPHTAVLPAPRSTEGKFVPISARGEQEKG